jgi:6-pyruvoyl-tetrahydropterin synthase
MFRTITVKTSFDATHCYPDAPEEVKHLRSRHRHKFGVEVEVEVNAEG